MSDRQIWRRETDRRWVVQSRPMHGWFYTGQHCRRRRGVHGGKCRQGAKSRASTPNCDLGGLGRAPLTPAGYGRSGLRLRTSLFVLCPHAPSLCAPSIVLSAFENSAGRPASLVHKKHTDSVHMSESCYTKARTAHFLSCCPVDNHPRSRNSNPA